MTAEKLIERYELTVYSLPEPDREVKGGYIGDLLSWVMGKAKADNVWITIMSNINTVAVASLSDTGLVIFAEGVIPDNSLITAALAKGINLAGSGLSAFDLAVKLSEDIS